MRVICVAQVRVRGYNNLKKKLGYGSVNLKKKITKNNNNNIFILK